MYEWVIVHAQRIQKEKMEEDIAFQKIKAR